MILFQILLKPVHPPLGVLHGISITKPEVTFCIAPEIDSWRHSDFRLHKDIKGQAVGVLRELLGVCQYMEGARGLYSDSQSQTLEPWDEEAASAVIGLSHPLNIMSRLFKTGQGTPLGKGT